MTVLDRTTCLLTIALFGAACFASTASAQGEPTLAQKAKQVLQTHCYRCHGENGAVEGGVNYLLDRNQLVGRGKVVPKEPAKSRIIRRIENEEMPPDDIKKRPSAAELAILKEWIAAGAMDFSPAAAKRAFISHQTILEAIELDLSKRSDLEKRWKRYFTFAHLANAGISEDELSTYRQALSKLLNSLSWGKQIVPPTAIDDAQMIYRIDLRDYKWTEETWRLLEAHYPYGLQVNSAAERACNDGTRARMPLLRGDWFVASAALPPLYHDLLALPTTDRALEKLLRVNVLTNLRDAEAMRAAFNSSGVSRNNRLIERHSSLFGAYWKSYDFAGNTDRQNLFASPLGPGVRVNSFKHDGGEIIFSLPNGLQGYLLTDAKGQRLDKGPTEIVSDPRRPDRSVVNGLSCMSCHVRGIITKDDQIRPHVEKNAQAFLKEELQQILALYPTHAKMRKVMEEDADRFRKAVEKTGCRLGATEPIVALAQRFEAELDRNSVAAELGMSVAQLQKHFAKSVTLGRQMGGLAVEGGTVQRDVFTEAYASVVKDLELGSVMPREQRSVFSWSAPARSPGWTPPTWPPRVGPPIDPPVKPKAMPRIYVNIPSSTNDDPWYYRLGGQKDGQIHAVAISPKDKWLTAVEGKPGIVSIYHRTHQEIWANLVGHQGNVLALDFSPDGSLVASGSIDQTARVWHVASGTQKHRLSDHAGFVRAVKFSPDGRWLATGSERVRLWDVTTGSERAAYAKTPTWVNGLAFTSDSKIIASASKTVELRQVPGGDLVTELADHTGSALAVAFSPSDQVLAYGTSDGAIYLWDRETKKVRLTLKGHQAPVVSLAFNCNGKILVSVSKPEAKLDGEYKVWDAETGKELVGETGHKGGISCIAIAPDGCHTVTAGLDGHLRFRDLMALGKVALGPFEGHYLPISSAVLSRDSSLAVSTGGDRTARVWKTSTGAQLHRLDGHEKPVHGALITNDNKHAYTTSGDKTLRKWDLATGKEVQRWTFAKSVGSLVASADGKTMAFDVSGAFTRVLDVATGNTIQDIKGPRYPLTLSPDGTKLAGALFKQGLRVWDVKTGEEIASFGHALTYFSSVAFSPDGKHVLTGAHDHSVSLWDFVSGKEIRRYKGCKHEVHAVAFAPGGRVLATSGGQKIPIVDGKAEYVGCAVFLWEADGSPVFRWDGQSTIIRRIAVSSTEPFALFIHNEGIKKVVLP